MALVNIFLVLCVFITASVTRGTGDTINDEYPINLGPVATLKEDSETTSSPEDSRDAHFRLTASQRFSVAGQNQKSSSASTGPSLPTVSLSSTSSPTPVPPEGSSTSPGAHGRPTTPESRTIDPLEVCPDIGGDQVAGSVIKCYCQGNEILVGGKCQPYDETTVIPTLKDYIFTVEEPTTDFIVTVSEVNCDPAKYLSFNFTKGQFHLRPRGDVVLLGNAGVFEGQRINKYCLIHHMDSQGDLTYTAKTCVPIPSVPRCCPHGQSMIDGSCRPAKTPLLLTPPIAAKPFSDAVAWPNITNYISRVDCQSESMVSIPLNDEKVNLVSLADGLATGWVPEAGKRRQYYKCPEFCIDGIENPDGSTDYFTNFCYDDPVKAHKKSCANGPCIRKCCKHGYSVDANRHSCVPDSNNTFNPPTEVDLADLNVVIGWPLCTPVTRAEGKISVNKDGQLNSENRLIPPSDFCIETFINNDVREQSALLCLNETPTWLKVRPVLFPVCKVISLLFLSVTIIYLLNSPGLQANGVMHLVCYAISLCVGYSASIAVSVSSQSFSETECFNTAIFMQFGYLSTYFWLNIICFETWRKVRSLKSNLKIQSYTYSLYVLYGWGIPLCISTITIAMQNLASDNTWGIIKPYIGISKCWFNDDIGTLVYFYGPTTILFTCNVVLLITAHLNFGKVLRDRKESAKIEKKLRSDEEKHLPGELEEQDQGFHCISTKLNLLTFVAICWCTEVISWKVPPIELWAVTDILNSLQGVFVFLLLVIPNIRTVPLEDKGKTLQKLSKKLHGKLKATLFGKANTSVYMVKASNPAVLP